MLIIAQIFLVSYQDDGNVGAEVFDLWGPLLWNVFCEARRAGERGNRSIIIGKELSVLCTCVCMSEVISAVKIKIHCRAFTTEVVNLPALSMGGLIEKLN